MTWLSRSYNCAYDAGAVGLRAYLADDYSGAAAVLVVSERQLRDNAIGIGLCIVTDVIESGPGAPCFETWTTTRTFPDQWSDDDQIVLATSSEQ